MNQDCPDTGDFRGLDGTQDSVAKKSGADTLAMTFLIDVAPRGAGGTPPIVLPRAAAQPFIEGLFTGIERRDILLGGQSLWRA